MGLIPRKSTMNAIFAMNKHTEKYEKIEKELYVVFVDLGKALHL